MNKEEMLDRFYKRSVINAGDFFSPMVYIFPKGQCVMHILNLKYSKGLNTHLRLTLN